MLCRHLRNAMCNSAQAAQVPTAAATSNCHRQPGRACSGFISFAYSMLRISLMFCPTYYICHTRYFFKRVSFLGLFVSSCSPTVMKTSLTDNPSVALLLPGQFSRTTSCVEARVRVFACVVPPSEALAHFP